VQRTLATTSPTMQAELRESLVRWLESAFAAGLDSESALALFLSTIEEVQQQTQKEGEPV